ncbi:DNA (cytosine-5)-methyltransferase 1 [Rhizobium sp. BK591]|uniref:DNA cytosine methyltransferase n=1 Tax=Rhizobium sp. BK591 TaxID=2586985 RepID=UPI001618F15D|nr:DNA (cytosine-5-)-methyltransferase [Rhizobium sp. BK591]MBB3743505.1 DNA (cytosine-5)-methyltransferase 1 [Rhizobium sp. BK591]
MRVVELFCGAGGMSLGLKRAGFDVVAAYDNNEDAVKNYCRNVGPHAHEADLSNLLLIVPKLLELSPDMICGGPPCQDYSPAGSGVEKENAKLTLAFALTIVAVRPTWFLMENVKEALGKNKKTWPQAREVLKNAGYGITEVVIDCSRYGVPQARKRLIAVGRLGECDGFLETAIREAATPKQLTIRQAFSNTFGRMPDPDNPWNPEIAEVIATGHVFTRPFYNGRGVRTVDEPFATITRTSAEPPTGRFRSQTHPRDSAHPTDTAAMTPYVMSRLQGFPHRWKWSAGNDRDLMQMIANAVPAPVIKIIGEVIASRQEGSSYQPADERFLQWLVRGGHRSRDTARNIKSNVGRARHMLYGRTFADITLEIAALEKVPGFDTLRTGTKSDLRQALRLHREYRDEIGRKGQATEDATQEADRTLRRRPQRPRRVDLDEMMAGLLPNEYHSEGGNSPDDIMDKYVTI